MTGWTGFEAVLAHSERTAEEVADAVVLRLIKEAVEDGKIVPVNEGAAGKLMKYTPVVGAGSRVGEG